MKRDTQNGTIQAWNLPTCTERKQGMTQLLVFAHTKSLSVLDTALSPKKERKGRKVDRTAFPPVKFIVLNFLLCLLFEFKSE